MINKQTKKNRISILIILVMIVSLLTPFSVEAAAPSVPFKTFTKNSPFSSTGYNPYYHNKDKFNGKVIVNFIDISSYQDKSTNLEKAKLAGVDAAVMRVGLTYCSSGERKEDCNWKSHFKKARAAGMMTGLYYFSQAKTVKEAKKEANLACNLYEKGIKSLYGENANPKEYMDLPIYMDYEFLGKCRISDMSKKKRTKCAKAFCSTIKSRGYKSGMYANVGFLNNSVDGAAVEEEGNDIWAAQYWRANEYTKKYSKWQYSSSAVIPGIIANGKQGRVDVNFWYVNKSSSVKDSDAKNIANCEINSIPAKLYSGKAFKPSVTVKFKGTTLKEGKSYKVNYINNSRIGTAYVYVRGKGKYSGHRFVPFTIKGLKETKITKLSGRKKSFKATWEKKKGISGYQIQYSRYKNMTLDLIKTVKSSKTTSKVFNTNFRRYKYYVRIRTYKISGKKKYYSKWSAKKTVYVK